MCYNKKALPLRGKNLVIRAFLVERASGARPHNKDASAKGGELCYSSEKGRDEESYSENGIGIAGYSPG